MEEEGIEQRERIDDGTEILRANRQARKFNAWSNRIMRPMQKAITDEKAERIREERGAERDSDALGGPDSESDDEHSSIESEDDLLGSLTSLIRKPE